MYASLCSCFLSRNVVLIEVDVLFQESLAPQQQLFHILNSLKNQALKIGDPMIPNGFCVEVAMISIHGNMQWISACLWSRSQFL